MKEIQTYTITELSPAVRDEIRQIVTEVIQEIVPGIVMAVIKAVVPQMIKEAMEREFEKFAIMVQHGFEATATKDDLNEFRREMGIITDKNDSRLDDHEERLIYLEGSSA